MGGQASGAPFTVSPDTSKRQTQRNREWQVKQALQSARKSARTKEAEARAHVAYDAAGHRPAVDADTQAQRLTRLACRARHRNFRSRVVHVQPQAQRRARMVGTNGQHAGHAHVRVAWQAKQSQGQRNDETGSHCRSSLSHRWSPPCIRRAGGRACRIGPKAHPAAPSSRRGSVQPRWRSTTLCRGREPRRSREMRSACRASRTAACPRRRPAALTGGAATPPACPPRPRRERRRRRRSCAPTTRRGP